MTTETKQAIIAAAHQYMKDKGLSQNAMCTGSKINAGYLTYMLKGDLSVNGTEISDKWYTQLAEYVGYRPENNFWVTRQTPQLVQVAAALESARIDPTAMMIIGETGSGKSLVVNKFVNNYPQFTYRITVADYYRITDIINQMCEIVGVGTHGVLVDRMFRLQGKLQEHRRNGYNPVMIVDEAENLKVPSIKLFKGLYDMISGHCSIVLIGTDDLINKMEKGCRKATPGMAQFRRRFKAGIRYLPSIDTMFTEILEPLKLPAGLVALLRKLCTNYGELRDYLEPALREAARLNMPLTEDLFRTIYNMPKQ